MKKQLLSALFISGIFSISTVQAHENTSLDKTTISAGYAQIKLPVNQVLCGGNLYTSRIQSTARYYGNCYLCAK